MLPNKIQRIRQKKTEEIVLLKVLANNSNFWLVLGIDLLLVVLALYLSYAVRFEDTLHGDNIRQFFGLLPLLIVVKISCFYFFGLYRGMWRYTSTGDLWNILKASITAAVIIIVLLLYHNRFAGLSRSVFVLDTLFTFLFIIGHRVSIRYYYLNSNKGKEPRLTAMRRDFGKRLLLVGAGDAAEKVLREIKENNQLQYRAVGLVDDDLRKTGMKIHGVPVLGVLDDLAEHAERVSADEILIAISSISGSKMKRIVKICQVNALPHKVVPGIGELINGKLSLSTIRDIDYKDLLGRDEVDLDQEKIGEYLNGKTVLITGAGGSIGSELCRQIVSFSPSLIILYDASEENLYSIQMELINVYQSAALKTVLGKVQDISLLNRVFIEYRPQVVFHAAAYKHVPILENNSWQAIDNNIIATQLLIEASVLNQVERFVLVSTDKAVRPTNVMGASKRLTELLMQAYEKRNWDGTLNPCWKSPEQHGRARGSGQQTTHSTIFVAVRFGNVIGSSGSVIPLFKKQIERGGPVTVTHPEMTRYFMSIEEASQLILQAGSMGEGGEIYILKMGEPIKINRMAQDLIRLAGKEPNSEIEIQYTGLREGEKLYEELITVGEGIVKTSHTKILVLRGDSYIACNELQGHINQLARYSKEHDEQAIKETLASIIPEYSPYFKPGICCGGTNVTGESRASEDSVDNVGAPIGKNIYGLSN